MASLAKGNGPQARGGAKLLGKKEEEVEKLYPSQEQGSWKDRAVWIGIGVAVVVSIMVSLYLYLIQM